MQAYDVRLVNSPSDVVESDTAGLQRTIGAS